jgi:putative Ca2+/H+ antiporter (TMEM165/GDT1 family)
MSSTTTSTEVVSSVSTTTNDDDEAIQQHLRIGGCGGAGGVSFVVLSSLVACLAVTILWCCTNPVLVTFTAATTTLNVCVSTIATSITRWIVSSFTENIGCGFYQSFSLVLMSEIGDKTFFIAALLAMKTSQWISFVGSIGALFLMTILSVLIGQFIHHVLPLGFMVVGTGNSNDNNTRMLMIPFDEIAAVIAFTFFGTKTLRDAFAMGNDESGKSSGGTSMDEELEEAKQVVKEHNTGMNQTNILQTIFGISTLIFAAELGDRSFLSSIALSASQNPWSVSSGAMIAHMIATSIAVSGGSMMAHFLSEKIIGIISGILFLLFAITSAFGILFKLQ